MLSRPIETRVHQTCVRGLFKTSTVECQGRARAATFHSATDIGDTRLVMAIADVCDSFEGVDVIESLAKTIVDDVLQQLDERNSGGKEKIDWKKLESIVESKSPALGVALSLIICKQSEEGPQTEENTASASFNITLIQLGGTVDIWCARKRVEHVENGGEEDDGPLLSPLAVSLERWASRQDAFATIPHCAPLPSPSSSSSASAVEKTSFAYMPLDTCLGARLFTHVSHRPRIRRFVAHSGDRIFVQSNGFEDLPWEPVAQWLPWGLMRAFSNAEDGDWQNVLDNEMQQEASFAHNRFLAVLQLRRPEDATKSFYGRGAGTNQVSTSIRAGKYVPGADEEFEEAFARHCRRLGADKLRMIALYNEQCGALAGMRVDVNYMRGCAREKLYKQMDDDDEKEEEDSDFDYEWYYRPK